MFLRVPSWVIPLSLRHLRARRPRQLLDELVGRLDLRPMLAVVTAQREAIIPLVLAGAGVALVPETLARFAERFGAVVSLPDPPAVRRLGLVHRRGELSPAATRFCEMARFDGDVVFQ